MGRSMINKKGFITAVLLGVWVLTLGFPGKPAWAAASRSKSINDLSRQLYNASGIGQEKQILSKKKMQSSFLTRPRMLQALGLSEEHIDIINNIYKGTFRTNDFYSQKLNKIKSNYHRGHAAGAIQFFRSGVGRKVVKLNNKALKASRKAYGNFLEKIVEKLPEKDRLEMFDQLEKAMGSVDLAIDMETSILRLTNPVGLEFNAPHADILVNRLKSELREQLRSQELLGLMFTYRSLSDRELKKYIQFMESSSGQWFAKVNNEGYLAGFATVNRQALRKMEKILKVMESGHQNMQTTRAVFAPGLRYMFSEKRDPFKPLVAPEPEEKEKKGPAGPSTGQQAGGPGKPDDAAIKVMETTLGGLPAIPFELYERIKESNPRLYSDLEYYGALFKNKIGLSGMKASELKEEVAQYNKLIAKAKEEIEQLVQTPLQADLNQLTLAGVMWDQQETVGLIETSDAKGHTIRVGSFVGPDFGVVQSIDEERVVILERLRKYDGKIVTLTKFIEFSKPDAEE